MDCAGSAAEQANPASADLARLSLFYLSLLYIVEEAFPRRLEPYPHCPSGEAKPGPLDHCTSPRPTRERIFVLGRGLG